MMRYPVGTILTINDEDDSSAFTGVVIGHTGKDHYFVKWTHSNDVLVYNSKDISCFLKGFK